MRGQVLALVLALAPTLVAADEPQLEELRDAILGSRERVEGHERRERALFDRLEEIGRNLVRLDEAVVEADRAARAARVLLDETREEVEVVARRLEASRAQLSSRAVELYKLGDTGPVQMLFAAVSLRDFLSRLEVMQAVVEHDAQLVARVRADHDALATARREASDALAHRDETALRLADRKAALAAERDERARLLSLARASRLHERALLVELERAAAALEEAVASLGQAAAPRSSSLDGAGFEGRRGALPPPVAAMVSRAFGRVLDEEFRTETFRKGVEFDAALGTAVAAVAPGEVRFADWFRGYGKIVILDHGDDYFTVSGHLSRIDVDVGDRVAEGDPIGKVGETGTLSGPSLYFELRRGAEPIDPAAWFGSAGG